MTPQKMEDIILADDWYYVGTTGAHKHYKHMKKVGKVTIPFHSHPKDLNIRTLCNIFKQAQLDKNLFL